MNHGIPLIPGVSIQCVNGAADSYHLIDFFLQPDECATVINLCSDRPV